MKVNSQLERAQLENLTSLPSAATAGRIAFDTVDGRIFMDDATNWRALLRNDQKMILGNSGTAANNIRFHRGANGVLQMVSGADSTAEGSLSTALNQLSSRNENYAAAGIPAFGNAGRVVYITDTGFLNVDTGAAWKALVDATTTQTLTNKTISGGTISGSGLTGAIVSDALIFTQIATPATPSAGTNKVYTKSDKQLYLLDETGLETQVGSGGGSGTGKNYLGTVNNVNGNGNFDLGSTSKWGLFNTTLTSLIPTGSITAGAASITTFAATTSGKLAGTYSLSAAGSGAITAGQGFLSDAVTFDLEDQIKACSFSFSYQVVSGLSNLNFSGTSANSFAVYIYDVTNSAWIQPAGVYGMTTGVGVGKVQGSFQTTGGTQYRLAVVCINTTGGAASLLFDSFTMGPQAIVQGTVISDWVDYTPTTQGLGTPTITQAQWRRVGGDIEIKVKLTTGTVTGVEARVGLPTGVTSSSTIPTLAPANGFYLRGAASVSHGGSMLIEPSVAYLTFGPVTTFGSTSSIGLAKENGNTIISSTEVLAFTAKIPVQGWSSNVQMSNDTDTRVVALEASVSSQSISNASLTLVTGWNTPAINTHAAFSGGVFTAPVSGIYEVTGVIGFATGTTGARYAQVNKNGSLYRYGVQLNAASTGSGATPTVAYHALVPLNAGETTSVSVFQSQGSSLALATGQESHISIRRLSGPSVIAANETVAAIYESSAGQSISNNSETVVVWGTKVKDTHGSMNSGTGVFTVPVSGIYEVTALNTFSSNATGVRYIVASQTGSATKDYLGPLLVAHASGGNGIGASMCFDCKAGDTLSTKVFQTSGGSLALSASGSQNLVCIKKIGN